MRYLPINIDTADKNFLVLGWQDELEDILKEILVSMAKVYVISPEMNIKIQHLIKTNPDKFLHKEQVVDENTIFFSYDYVIIATGDLAVDNAMELRAKKSSIPFFRLDKPKSSDFSILPKAFSEELSLSVSTRTYNPTIENKVLKDLQIFLTKYDPEKFSILNEIRTALVKKNSPDVDKIIKELYDSETINLSTYLVGLKDENRERVEEFEGISSTENLEDVSSGEDREEN